MTMYFKKNDDELTLIYIPSIFGASCFQTSPYFLSERYVFFSSSADGILCVKIHQPGHTDDISPIFQCWTHHWQVQGDVPNDVYWFIPPSTIDIPSGNQTWRAGKSLVR